MSEKKIESSLCDGCEEIYKVMIRKAQKLMFMLHDLKHIMEYYDTRMDFYNAFIDMFPFFRDVECYNPNEHDAVSYLFDVVLVEKDDENLR